MVIHSVENRERMALKIGSSRGSKPLKRLQYLPTMEEVVVDAWRITSFSVVGAFESPLAIFVVGPAGVGMVVALILSQTVLKQEV